MHMHSVTCNHGSIIFHHALKIQETDEAWPTSQTIPVSAVNNTQRALILQACEEVSQNTPSFTGRKRLPTVSLLRAVFTALWYYIVLTHNVGFLSLIAKPFLYKRGSATVYVQQWVDLQIPSTITWFLQHTKIILWAPDQISPPSHSV